MSNKSKIITAEGVFRMHWLCWKFLGYVPSGKHDKLYNIYSIALKVWVNIMYPLHLSTSLFISESAYDLFKNVAVNIAVPVICIKTFIMWYKTEKLHKVDVIIRHLESHIDNEEDVHYYQNSVIPTALRMRHLFYIFLMIAYLSREAMVLIGVIFFDEWNLLYMMYLPFDVSASPTVYAIVHIYQFFTFAVLAAEAIFLDSYGAMNLVMMGGHVRLLCRRIMRIGEDKRKTLKENNDELQQCILDHKFLMELHAVVEDIISWPTFAQIIAFGMNISMVAVSLVFFSNDLASYIFYGSFITAVSTQMFPVCYYGTNLEYECEKLSYSIFSAKWIDQSREFKQNLRIFAEQTLRNNITKAGFFFNVNLQTFFSACKATYSLMAVVLRMK